MVSIFPRILGNFRTTMDPLQQHVELGQLLGQQHGRQFHIFEFQRHLFNVEYHTIYRTPQQIYASFGILPVS